MKMNDVLKRLYPVWEQNCRESARWLLSGEEYEQWFISQGQEMDMLPHEKRKEAAAEYLRRAEKYKTLGSGAV